MPRRLWTLIMISLLSLPLFGQDGSTSNNDDNILFRINRIEADNDSRFVEVFVNAKDGEQAILPENITITASDQVNNGEFNEGYQEVEVLTSSQKTIPQVLFLLDISGSMREGNKIGKAKTEIKNLLDKHEFGAGSTYFATFGNDVSESVPLTRSNYESVVGNIVANNNNTDLNYAIREKIQEMNNKSGIRVIILLTDGRDANYYNEKYTSGRASIVTPEMVETTALEADPAVRLYAIGYGDKTATARTYEDFQKGIDEEFLTKIVNATPSKEDDYNYTNGPELASIFEGIMAEIEENIVIHFRPQECDFIGRPRNVKLAYNYNGKTGSILREYSLGSSAAPLPLCSGPQSNKLSQILIGVIFIVALLGLLQYLVPVISTFRFKKKYVMPYADYLAQMGQASTKKRRMDPYTGEALLPQDLIVTKCEHLNRWESWEYNNHKCVFYPDKGCSQGFSNYNKKANFFRQQGINRRLNWLWFGALGGLVSWLIFNLLDNVGISALYDTIETNFPNDAASLYRQVLVGISMGAGLALCLAISEELGTSRSSRAAVPRILKRVAMGIVLAFPIFFFQEWFYNNVLSIEYIGGLIGWILFGVALGYIVSIDSSIEAKKGIQGGALAALIAYQIFFIIFKLFDPSYANLFGYIIFGGILGYLIVAVVERLEKFELVVQSPDTFAGRKIAISKWLTSGQNNQIYIGSDPSVYVYVKWRDDTVLERHAALSYDGKVYIEGLGETLVNGSMLTAGQRRELKNNDLIQLGRSSISMFRFLSAEDEQGPSIQAVPEETTAREEQLRSRIKIKVPPRNQ